MDGEFKVTCGTCPAFQQHYFASCDENHNHIVVKDQPGGLENGKCKLNKQYVWSDDLRTSKCRYRKLIEACYKNYKLAKELKAQLNNGKLL